MYSQGLTKDQEEDKDSQGHWWRVKFQETAVWPSGEEKEKEKPLYPHSKPLGLILYIGLYSKVDVACKKNGVSGIHVHSV